MIEFKVLRRSAQSSVEKALIHWRELDTQCRLQFAKAECTQLSSLKSPIRGDRASASMPAASERFGECHERHVTQGVGIAGDVEAAQR